MLPEVFSVGRVSEVDGAVFVKSTLEGRGNEGEAKAGLLCADLRHPIVLMSLSIL